MINKTHFSEKYNNISPAVRASFWFLLANILQKSIMIILTPIFTRIMSTEQYSQYALFQSWETVITVFATLNISVYATSKALADFEQDRKNYIVSAESLTVVLSTVVFLAYLLLHFVFNKANFFPEWIMVLMFVDIVFTTFFTIWSQMERYNLKYRALSIVSVLMGVCSPMIAIILTRFSDEIGINKGWTRIIGLVSVDLLVGLYIYIGSIKKGKIFWSIKYWKFLFDYSLPLIPHFLATAFLQRISQIFVNKYCVKGEAGIFALANTLSMLMMVINDAFTKMLVPWTYQKISEKKYKEINKPVIIALFIIGIADISMALVAPEIVYIFANKAYANAIYAIPPLVATCYFGFLYNTFSNIEYYFKETKMVSFASVTAGIIILLLEWFLVPKFGFCAAAYSALISYFVYTLMHYWFMQKTLRRHLGGLEVYNNKFILKLSIGFVGIIMIIPILYKLSVVRYATLIFGFAFLIINYKKILAVIKDHFFVGSKKI